ncbi:MAG: hypothetical protein HFI06_11940 [Eubacterium sp.]|jgi:hypothetical protein|nr:hypothetical protein [Eubacterium sp.]
MSEKFDSDFLKLMIEKIMERYGLCALISEFCDTVEVIECGDLYQCCLHYQENVKQRKKIVQCGKQYEYIDATIIMPQQKNKKAYILLSNCELVDPIRKTIHEFIHLYHRCIITKKMKLNNLYEIEDYHDYKYFYFLDEFLTKKKEIIVLYDFFYGNQKVADDSRYINNLSEKLGVINEPSRDIMYYMRDGLFTLAECIAYMSIFPDIFPENFIEKNTNISDVDTMVNLLKRFDSIDVFIKNKTELEAVIKILERNFYTNYQ